MWPGLGKLAKRHEYDPIIFIGVSSGTTTAQMRSYIDQHNVSWPLILDEDREFEKACGVNTISLQNIHQVRYISGDGTLGVGRSDDILWSVGEALKDASWRIDPSTIPDELKPAWRDVEQQKYDKCSESIRAAMTTGDSETKKAAKTLYAAAMKDLRKRADEAWQLGKSGEKWRAFVAIEDVRKDFEGFPIPKKLLSAHNTLKGQTTVQNEVRANKLLTGAKELIATKDKKKIASAVRRLESLEKRFPDTESAKLAKAVLAELDEETK